GSPGRLWSSTKWRTSTSARCSALSSAHSTTTAEGAAQQGTGTSPIRTQSAAVSRNLSLPRRDRARARAITDPQGCLGRTLTGKAKLRETLDILVLPLEVT